MRQPRIKMNDQDTWHHCYNRTAGTSSDRPFKDAEKEQFIRILKRVGTLYTVRIISYQVMSNHFHILLHAPAQPPSLEETCRRFRQFHYGKRSISPDSPACLQWQARCRDVSWFMRHLQHLYTAWYNRSRNIRRRGSLWADRYKNTILQDGHAVWACWNYIENNPVRAGMVEDPADYRFCSYGAWSQSGRHPFESNIRKIVLPLMQEHFGVVSLGDIRLRMAEMLAAKAGKDWIEPGFTMTIQRSVRHWTDGLVIGSELFVREVMSRYRPAHEVARHRMARSRDPACLFAWRRVRPAESG